MKAITTNELKNNIEKYVELAMSETIQVSEDGKTLFTIIPEKEKMLSEWDNLFGSLPKEALIDKDISRE